jgi:hypothetical protein
MFKPGYLFLYLLAFALVHALPAPFDGLAALVGICSGLIFIGRLLAPRPTLEARP